MSARGSERRVALVTGASSGLGRAIALRLGRAGWTVALVARREDRLGQLADALRAAGGAPLVFAGDLRQPDFTSGLVARVVEAAGRLDLLVNNACAPSGTSEGAADDAAVDRTFALNVRSLYRLSALAVPHLGAHGGSIINIGSAGVTRTVAIDLVYLATKGAAETLTRGMAKKWAELGVRVNTVSPGIIDTEIYAVSGIPPEAVERELAAARARFQLLPRPGTADDVAAAVEFLASADAAFITGATLHVDGGMAIGG